MGAKPIHVLQVINTARVGGGMGHLYALVKALIPPEFKTTIAATDEGYLTEQLREDGFDFVDIDMMRSRFNPGAIWRLARLFKRLDVDIVHLHGTRAGWFGGLAGLAASGHKSIYTVHGFSFNKAMPSFGRAFYTQIERLLALMHDRLISVSETDRRDAVAKRICSPDKIVTIHNGVDLARFDPQNLNGHGAMVRRSWGIDESSPLIGTVARLVPQKGIEYFMEAAKIVRRKLPETRFVVIGEGELLPKLKQGAESLGFNGELKFVGPFNEMPEALCALDVFVLSSLWEGHPISLLEALAMQRPSVATYTSGTPEILRDRETGLLVPPKDPRSLAEAVLYLLEHPSEAAEMAARGREEVARRFCVDNMVESTLNIYRELAEA